MSKEAAVEKMVARVDTWGGVDVMFNNAGIMHGEVSYFTFTEGCIVANNNRRIMKLPLRLKKSGI